MKNEIWGYDDFIKIFFERLHLWATQNWAILKGRSKTFCLKIERFDWGENFEINNDHTCWLNVRTIIIENMHLRRNLFLQMNIITGA